MGAIVGIVAIFVVLGILGAIWNSGNGLAAIICLMVCGGIGFGLGSWLGGDGWAIFGAILGGVIGLAAVKEGFH